MQVAEFFDKYNFQQEVDVEPLLREFDRHMTAGLGDDPKSLKMLPAYLSVDKQVSSDTPIIVLDAGGTNLRVAVLWFDAAGKARIEDFRKHSMPGTTGETLGEESFSGNSLNIWNRLPSVLTRWVFVSLIRQRSRRHLTGGFCTGQSRWRRRASSGRWFVRAFQPRLRNRQAAS